MDKRSTAISPADAGRDSGHKVGVLLVNHGTPQDPTVSAVRRYLREVLSDPWVHRHVVELPRPVWWLLLNTVILPTRARRSASAYRSIWTDAGPPLLLHSQALLKKLDRYFCDEVIEPVHVELAMRYGSPSIPFALAKLQDSAIRRLVVLPLMPQPSGPTSPSIFDEVTRHLRDWRPLPDLCFVNGYHDEREFIATVVNGIHAHWKTHGRADRLLISFHSVSQRGHEKGDPRYHQSEQTARRIASQLMLPDDDWAMGFQSRVGRGKWLKPDTFETLRKWGQAGTERVQVVCPCFTVDCLETLEEIAVRGNLEFLQAGSWLNPLSAHSGRAILSRGLA